jgi:hypothetical protein
VRDEGTSVHKGGLKPNGEGAGGGNRRDNSVRDKDNKFKRLFLHGFGEGGAKLELRAAAGQCTHLAERGMLNPEGTNCSTETLEYSNVLIGYFIGGCPT